jgi:hypothetical protein
MSKRNQKGKQRGTPRGSVVRVRDGGRQISAKRKGGLTSTDLAELDKAFNETVGAGKSGDNYLSTIFYEAFGSGKKYSGLEWLNESITSKDIGELPTERDYHTLVEVIYGNFKAARIEDSVELSKEQATGLSGLTEKVLEALGIEYKPNFEEGNDFFEEYDATRLDEEYNITFDSKRLPEDITTLEDAVKHQVINFAEKSSSNVLYKQRLQKSLVYLYTLSEAIRSTYQP